MSRNRGILPLVLLALCGCSTMPGDHTGRQPSQSVEVEIVKAREHLGHDTDTHGIHRAWYDGCRARIVGTGEPFVIYWMNGQIEGTGFRFSQGRRYQVWFTGEMKTGVMGYQGECIDVLQVVRVEERNKHAQAIAPDALKAKAALLDAMRAPRNPFEGADPAKFEAMPLERLSDAEYTWGAFHIHTAQRTFDAEVASPALGLFVRGEFAVEADDKWKAVNIRTMHGSGLPPTRR